MSYRHDQTRKDRRAKTAKQWLQIIKRDTQFCERWGIPEDQAWRWNRHPDRSLVKP